VNRAPAPSSFVNTHTVSSSGLTSDIIAAGIGYVYEILDAIDEKLISGGAFRLASMIELANLSSVVGNLLGSGIVRAAEGIFRRNRPHAYPDLLAKHQKAFDIEIKMALETNKPKGHLAKEGYYLTCRYVLGDEQGNYIGGKENRGEVVWIWEIRFGYLNEGHFNLSNTRGDSGKTAVVNAEGMKELEILFCDLDRCPYSKNSPTYRNYTQLYSPQSKMF
jgi:hypothetical protein